VAISRSATARCRVLGGWAAPSKATSAAWYRPASRQQPAPSCERVVWGSSANAAVERQQRRLRSHQPARPRSRLVPDEREVGIHCPRRASTRLAPGIGVPARLGGTTQRKRKAVLAERRAGRGRQAPTPRRRCRCWRSNSKYSASRPQVGFHPKSSWYAVMSIPCPSFRAPASAPARAPVRFGRLRNKSLKTRSSAWRQIYPGLSRWLAATGLCRHFCRHESRAIASRADRVSANSLRFDIAGPQPGLAPRRCAELRRLGGCRDGLEFLGSDTHPVVSGKRSPTSPARRRCSSMATTTCSRPIARSE